MAADFSNDDVRASYSGILPSVEKESRKLYYSEVYTNSEDEISRKIEEVVTFGTNDLSGLVIFQ